MRNAKKKERKKKKKKGMELKGNFHYERILAALVLLGRQKKSSKVLDKRIGNAIATYFRAFVTLFSFSTDKKAEAKRILCMLKREENDLKGLKKQLDILLDHDYDPL
jgi:hypothetical protein